MTQRPSPPRRLRSLATAGDISPAQPISSLAAARPRSVNSRPAVSFVAQRGAMLRMFRTRGAVTRLTVAATTTAAALGIGSVARAGDFTWTNTGGTGAP